MDRYRVITVARQYGSGGGPIACGLARRLGWELLDQALIARIAKQANVPRRVCEQLDESVDGWLYRLTKLAFGRGGLERVANFERLANMDVFDSEAMAALTRKLIEEAAALGNCVIVGRGAQCVLRGRPDVFHVFVYAPVDFRVERVRQELGPERATPEMVRESDRERAAYVKHLYGCEWCDPTLYEAMFSATLGDETVVDSV
ncbi:MAG: cytidylate kinase-like family protein, partial [Acidobacteriaceae bacterium]|nr:cytidylate kinase-like family protein [Acidobacteriaceae bacterium]